jgi:hypothetical protein
MMAAPDRAALDGNDTGRDEPGGEAGAEPGPDRSIGALLSDLAAEASFLVRQEFALFKAELGGKLVRVGLGLAALVFGALLLFSGWIALLAAAALALATVMAPWLAALTVALATVMIGLALLYFGRTRLRARSLRLQRTWKSLRGDRVADSERMS